MLILTATALGGLKESVSAVLADSSKLTPDAVRSTRYLSLYAVPIKDRKLFIKTLAFHCNNLSTRPVLRIPRIVNEELVAIDIRNYGWSNETYEKLAEEDPYFHAVLLVDEKYREKERYKYMKTLSIVTGKQGSSSASFSYVSLLHP